ncbi:MAG: hypothetical protein Q9217_007021, partial [Psora testacea]
VCLKDDILTFTYRIIVGVKYCFRYNQRNRRAQQDDNGEPIDMNTIPHTRRRRREKKLMTMDEVNERFPLLKYKAWMTTRAEEGLPTAGGVAAPAGSRAASLRNAEGVIPSARTSGDNPRSLTPGAKESMEQHNESPESAKSPVIKTSSEQPGVAETKGEEAKGEHKDADTPTIEPTRTNDSQVHPDDLDDDDQIQRAVPTEMMATPGDSCAICIDTLEDDDDVRGLTCGHAFHASCLDPWLTARRACCPLCKADYYIPKPRPEGEAAPEAERQAGRRTPGQRMDMPHPPQYAFWGHRHGRPRMLLAGRFMTVGHDDNARSRYGMPYNRRTEGRPNEPAPVTPAPSSYHPYIRHNSSTWRSRLTSVRPNVRMPALFRRNHNTASDASAHTGAPEINNINPSQLEAVIEAFERENEWSLSSKLPALAFLPTTTMSPNTSSTAAPNSEGQSNTVIHEERMPSPTPALAQAPPPAAHQPTTSSQQQQPRSVAAQDNRLSSSEPDAADQPTQHPNSPKATPPTTQIAHKPDITIAEPDDPKEEIEAFDWNELEARFHARLAECGKVEEEMEREFAGWLEVRFFPKPSIKRTSWIFSDSSIILFFTYAL